MAGRKRGKGRINRKKGIENKRAAMDIAARYLLLLLASLNSLWIFYIIFTPLTIQAAALLLKIFYTTEVYKNIILLNYEVVIDMVRACIAGSAYYLLLILNLTTARIKLKKRIWIFLFDSSLFFLLNIARISLLAIMQVNKIAAFDITHKLFWYGMSTIYVVLIWILTINIFKIKNIPVYSDFVKIRKAMKTNQI